MPSSTNKFQIFVKSGFILSPFEISKLWVLNGEALSSAPTPGIYPQQLPHPSPSRKPSQTCAYNKSPKCNRNQMNIKATHNDIE